MGRTEELITVRELVLLVVEAAGGQVVGRTAAQKLCYFAATSLGQDAGHRAHFYGPYSRPVEAALNNSAYAGDLEETIRPFASGSGGTYCYKLTDQGKQEVIEIRGAHPMAAGAIAETVSSLSNLVPGFDQSKLSFAAKVDLIVSARADAIDSDEIPQLATGHGWTVKPTEVTEAVEVLVGLGRVSVSQ